jgi:hypothetical protein
MRYLLIALSMSLGLVSSTMAQVSIGIGLPNASIRINLSAYPRLERVPNYPVYYAPQENSNFFFYDGLYWVYQDDDWYASSWYNGPWAIVAPQAVPLFILRIPVRYYRNPPTYFRGWRADAPPLWGEHWGREWEQQHSGWDRWDRRSAPTPAPLPTYQRKYPAAQYPRTEQQPQLQSQNYRYQPREPVVRQHYEQQGVKSGPAPSQRQKPAARPQPGRKQDAQKSDERDKGDKGDKGDRGDNERK